MPNLVLDSSGKPSPQYLNEAGSEFEYQRGKDGGMNVNLNGVNHKLPGDDFTGKVIPAQLIDKEGNIISNIGPRKKSISTIFSLGTKTDTATSTAIDTSDIDNVTFVIIANDLSNVSEFIVQGEFNGEYQSIYKISNSDNEITNLNGVVTVGINSNIPMILPNKIKVVLNVSASTTIATYMVSK